MHLINLEYAVSLPAASESYHSDCFALELAMTYLYQDKISSSADFKFGYSY